MAGRFWTEDEYRRLFETFPLDRPRPSGEGLARLARDLDRTLDAVRWQWQDAARYCAGKSTTAADALKAWLDRTGLCDR